MCGGMREPKDNEYWRRLHEAMEASGDFWGGRRMRPPALRQHHYAGRAVVYPATNGRVPRSPIWGYGTLLKTRLPDWMELGLVYVAPNERGKGWSRKIVQELLGRVPAGKSIFSITSKGEMMHVLDSYGFEPVTTQIMPDVSTWAEGVGLKRVNSDEDRLPASALWPLSPNPVEGERWLFVRRA